MREAKGQSLCLPWAAVGHALHGFAVCAEEGKEALESARRHALRAGAGPEVTGSHPIE